MKKLMVFVGVLTLMISYSCSNDFDLIEDFQDIPVVFGLLSQADSIHYIRVEKAFVDPNTSALEIAQIADSIYYESIGVSVEHEASGTVYQLDRVDDDGSELELRLPTPLPTTEVWIIEQTDPGNEVEVGRKTDLPSSPWTAGIVR